MAGFLTCRMGGLLAAIILTPVYHTREKLAPSLPSLLTISIFDYILNMEITIFDIKEGGGGARAKFQTLTEQMYYILLCLSRENCGMDVMDQIPAMTGDGSGGTRHPLQPAGAVCGGGDDPGDPL